MASQTPRKVADRSGIAAELSVAFPAATLLKPGDMAAPRRFVYVLYSECDQKRYYTGLMSDVVGRIEDHSRGACSHTGKSRIWRLVVAIEFASEQKADAFERYLKSGSGVAFSVRHFK